MLNALAIGFFTALGTGLAVAIGLELRGLAGWISRSCLECAVRFLPPRLRRQRKQEWLAELDSLKNAPLSRLLWSVGYLMAAARIGARKRRFAPHHVRLFGKRAARERRAAELIQMRNRQRRMGTLMDGPVGKNPDGSYYISWREVADRLDPEDVRTVRAVVDSLEAERRREQ